MKLYMFPVAPNPTKVRLYLAEKEEAGGPIEIEQETVSLPNGEQRSDEHTARHPFQKLPVLELEDGTCLIESLAIIQYLEELHPDPPLIGADPLERARVRALERICELGVLYGVAWTVHNTNSPLGLPANPPVADFFRKSLVKPLTYLDGLLSDGRAFVAGESPTIADCTLAAAFQFARFGKLEIDPEYTHVARWDAAYRARGPAQRTLVL
jgi:glutathione S-transferase